MRDAADKADKHMLEICSRVEAVDATRVPKQWPSEHACSSHGQLHRMFQRRYAFYHMSMRLPADCIKLWVYTRHVKTS